jgi:hypothetical protein
MTRGHYRDSLSGPLLAWAFAVTALASALTFGVYYLAYTDTRFFGF